jgi:transposase
MKKSRTVAGCAAVESPRHLPLVDLLVDARTELFELAVRSGLKVLETMLEEDRTTICGPRYAHVADRQASRSGTVSSEVVLGGRKVAVRRPRVRADGREVPLPTFQAMADVDPLNRRVVEQMLVGVATRRYARSLERFRLVHSTAVMVLLSSEVTMAAAYSMDLRERVAKAWDEIGDADEIAETFRVSRAWIHRLIQRRRETGSLAPRQQTKFRSRVLAGQEERLAAVITARPDATLAEIRDALPTTAALSTLWLEIDRLGLTVKKNGARRRTAST